MASAQLTLRVITPERILLDEPVQSVSLTALDGSMGVLPRHANMVAALDVGVLEYRDSSGKLVPMFVGGGFAEVRDNTVRVVAPVGEQAEQIDEERAASAEKRARERLDQAHAAGGVADIDLIRAQAALRRALARERVARRRS
ncbi:MAG: ATP synthase F1 subunit epsilon [Planctomycetota bacterium]